VFLKSYGDDSSDAREQEIVCAGSFLGWPREFYYAGLQWEDRLKKDKIPYFRATECEGLFESFSPETLGVGLSEARASALSVRYDLIEMLRGKQTGLGAIAVGLLRKDFNELIAENEKARALFGTDPVRLVYKHLIRATIELLDKDWPDMPKSIKIAFTFDEHQKWREAEEEYNKLKEQDEGCARRMLIAGHADDKEFPGLQMADLAASEARLKTIRWINGSQEERLQFKQLARNENFYYIGVLDRKGLLAELDKEEGRLEKGHLTV
jgi:hypothetical protein